MATGGQRSNATMIIAFHGSVKTQWVMAVGFTAVLVLNRDLTIRNDSIISPQKRPVTIHKSNQQIRNGGSSPCNIHEAISKGHKAIMQTYLKTSCVVVGGGSVGFMWSGKPRTSQRTKLRTTSIAQMLEIINRCVFI